MEDAVKNYSRHNMYTVEKAHDKIALDKIVFHKVAHDKFYFSTL